MFSHSTKAHQDGSSITSGNALNQNTVHYCNTRGVLLVNGRDTVCEGEGLIMARYHLGRRALECGRYVISGAHKSRREKMNNSNFV